ncbi:hypothetical protein [Pseudomonas putida]|uniref:Uncharacterized protein n=1 Tax=Pseudomonas putida TaxID=303 RepID=A0A8I1EGJ0_PSEPU|nr:hypothetical protein [Pseudomonas putida]MBI6885101.1 hypothetical protein [Pseudomonas putida]
MLLPEFEKHENQNRAVYREVAQRLMAKHLGFKASGIQVKMTNGHVSGVSNYFLETSNGLVSPALVHDYLTKRIMVLCAGVWGEVHWLHLLLGDDMKNDHVTALYDNGVLDGSLLTNRAKILELSTILTGMQHEPADSYKEMDDQSHSLFAENYQRTVDYLKEHQDMFNCLAGLVLERPRSQDGMSVSDEVLNNLEEIAIERTAIEMADKGVEDGFTKS